VRAAREAATHYRVTTVRPDGRPHAVPVDGLWLDDVGFYGGSEQAVHYRNALAGPKADAYGSASSSSANGGSSTTSRKRPEATRPSTTVRQASQHG
jgi:hypothetical protein